MRIDLLERVAPEKREKYIVGLKEQILALKKLVEDVLDISQLDMMESVGTTLLPVDLNAVVEHVVSTYRPVAVNAGLDLIFEPKPALSPVMGEFNLLSRMIGNLIANAINYTSDGEIRINTRREAEADRVCVEIADTGIGIQPEDLPYLFKRFYRGKQTVSSNPPGTGLGLSIVKEVVDMHGGSIQVDSQPGAGTRFTIYLPSVPHFPPATDETDIA
jgi:signal transduction histidine kinase